MLALFFEDLLFAPWVQLLRFYTQQDLERALLGDPDALRGFAARFGPPTASPAGATP